MLAFYAAALEGRVGESEGRIPEHAPEHPTREVIQKKIDKKQPLTFLEHLFCHVPFYVRGRVLGSRIFLGNWALNTESTNGPQAIMGIQDVNLYTLSRIRGSVFSA